MRLGEILRRKLDEQRRITEAILADFVVDPTWTKGAIRRMVVVHAVAKRLGVKVNYPWFVPRVNRCVQRLGARPIHPGQRRLWRGLRRRDG